ncbi:1-acyl-sn-glycerol-3-phosphate acyltransferase [uncultured Propionibacterium sp.]|uniref:1-acyl-sn-glycerol-3-phosphate acyltransferase n=1 Tax=uncultured Propionibacterium sp. TaxID=218066 RepID=UPI0029302363|nr:1-acyl-sn-glycerol-3-phosphate acyltransferase [uncultured Propionibacterium sp.]
MRIRRALADLGWRLSPYRLVGREPPSQPGVFLGAPHTSNWDFIAFLGVAWHFQMPMKVLIKNSWVDGPVGPLIRAMGGIGVDRSRPGGLVDDLVRQAAQGDRFQLVIAPKGMRAPRPYWRSGFYRIALGSGLPVTLAGIDSERKEVEIGPTLTMTGDARADMDEIRAFYSRFAGLVPGRRSEPRLREEDAERPAVRQ